MIVQENIELERGDSNTGCHSNPECVVRFYVELMEYDHLEIVTPTL